MSAKTAGARMGKTAAEGQELMDNFFSQFPEVKRLIDDSKQMLKDFDYVEDWAGRRRHLPDFKLPAYEVKPLRAPGEKEFNPFLSCENRPTVSDLTLQKWDSIVEEKIKESQKAQKRRCEKENIPWVKNDEMSNKAYEQLAKDAAKEGVLVQANTGRRAQAERQCLNARIQGGAASLTKLAMVNVSKDQELLDLDAHLVITVHDEVLVECPMLYADKVEKRLPQVMIDTAKPFINVPMACDPYAERQWYIGEYSVSIQAEFKKLEEKGYSKEEALAMVIANHPEMFEDAIKNTIETGEEINTDLYTSIVEDIEDFVLEDEALDDSEDTEDEAQYMSLFD